MNLPLDNPTEVLLALDRELDHEVSLVPVLRPETRWLRLFRPHVVDLILTKMMRGDDPQDMEDVAFLVREGGVTSAEMEVAFLQVRMPELQELMDAFERALPRVREVLERERLMSQ